MKVRACGIARLRAALTTAVVVAMACGGSVARAANVLTVEKAGGPAALVGDEVVAKLETGTKVQFVKPNGEVDCNASEIKGTVAENPLMGAGKGVIEITTWSFGTCSSTIGGAGGTVKKVVIEKLPLAAKTEGTTGFAISEKNIVSMGVEIDVETAAHEQIACIFRAGPLPVKYFNANGEIEISKEMTGVQSVKNCSSSPNNSEPDWKAKYRPLLDETGARKGEQIFIN